MLSAHQRIPHRLWWLVEVVSMSDVARGRVGVDGGINALSTSKDFLQVVVAGRSGEYEGCGQGECRGIMEASMLSAHQSIHYRLWWLVVVSMRDVARGSVGVWRHQCSQHFKGFLTGCGGW